MESLYTEIIENRSLELILTDQVAMGIPLHRIRCIRVLYGNSPWGTNPIDFDNPEVLPRPKGHCISARITSENPDEGKFYKTLGQISPTGGSITWRHISRNINNGIHC